MPKNQTRETRVALVIGTDFVTHNLARILSLRSYKVLLLILDRHRISATEGITKSILRMLGNTSIPSLVLVNVRSDSGFFVPTVFALQSIFSLSCVPIVFLASDDMEATSYFSFGLADNVTLVVSDERPIIHSGGVVGDILDMIGLY